MEKYIGGSGIISFLYLIIKFLETKYSKTEKKPFKHLAIDTLLVFICCMVGLYAIDQFKGSDKNTGAFLNNPDF